MDIRRAKGFWLANSSRIERFTRGQYLIIPPTKIMEKIWSQKKSNRRCHPFKIHPRNGWVSCSNRRFNGAITDLSTHLPRIKKTHFSRWSFETCGRRRRLLNFSMSQIRSSIRSHFELNSEKNQRANHQSHWGMHSLLHLLEIKWILLPDGALAPIKETFMLNETQKENQHYNRRQEIIVETGEVAKQARGSVLSAAATRFFLSRLYQHEPKQAPIFSPDSWLQKKPMPPVKFLGGFFKREARPREKEILISALLTAACVPFSEVFTRHRYLCHAPFNW